MSHRTVAVILLSTVALTIALGGVSRTMSQMRQYKTQASTYGKTLMVLEETNTALMQVGAESTKIYEPNNIALAMFGYTYQEMNGMDVNMLIPDWYRPVHQAKMQEGMKRASMGETMYQVVTMDCMAKRKDGSEINVFVRVYIGKSGVITFINLASQAKFIRMVDKPPAEAKP